jgi:hypothetical protein
MVFVFIEHLRNPVFVSQATRVTGASLPPTRRDTAGSEQARLGRVIAWLLIFFNGVV